MKKLLLTPNQWSRPERPLEEVRAIVMHWVENPGTSAQHTWNWFDLRKDGQHGYGSTHFIIDAHNTIWALPLDEMGYHVGPKNKATPWAKEHLAPYANSFCIGVELCHPTAAGFFEESTLWQAANLCAELCAKYHLDPMMQIVRHYDVTGKNCPKYWVDYPERLADFKLRVAEIMSIRIQIEGVSS